MEFGYNTRLKGTRVEKERGKFGSILREDDHFKRPPSLARRSETYFSLFRMSRVVKLHAKQRVYIGMYVHASLKYMYMYAAIYGVARRWKRFYYSQSDAPRYFLDPFRFAETSERKSKSLLQQICK